jgi:Mg2+ and Co2+ transporter CorA
MNVTVLDSKKTIVQGHLDILSRLQPNDGFFWIDVDGASSSDLEDVAAALGIDPDAALWLACPGRRARVEMDKQRVRISTWSIDRDGRLGMVLALNEPSAWLLTVHTGAGPNMDRARRFFSILPGDQPVDWRRTIFVVLNELLTGFEPVIEQYDESLDALETRIFESPRPELLQELSGLRQQLLAFNRALVPHRDELRDFGVSVVGMLAGHLEQHLHEYRDRVERMVDDIGDKRQRVNDAIQGYGASVSNLQARVINRLTIISAIFLPLTFLTGFFGMNFQWMIDRIDSREAFWVLGVGLFVGTLTFALGLFWRLGWLGAKPHEKRTAAADRSSGKF